MYVVHVPSSSYHPLMLFRHDALAMLEDITAGNKQGRRMRDLISILRKRDVCGTLDLTFPFS